MSEEIRDDMSFEEMLKATEANANVYTGKIVKAKVISVSPTECIVGVDGSKHTGIVPLREMSHDFQTTRKGLVATTLDHVARARRVSLFGACFLSS